VRELNAAPGGELIVQTQSQSGLQEARLQNLTERNLTAALTRLSRGGKRQIAFISGHDERTTERVTNEQPLRDSTFQVKWRASCSTLVAAVTCYG